MDGVTGGQPVSSLKEPELRVVACEITRPTGSQELVYAVWLAIGAGKKLAELPRRELVYLAEAEAEINRLRAEVAELAQQRGDLAAQLLKARQLVSVSSIDIERMIAECVPGGSVCDPQTVADAIRRYCDAWPNVAPDGQPLAQADEKVHLTTDEQGALKRALMRSAKVLPDGDSVPPPVQPSGATLSQGVGSQWISVDERLPEIDYSKASYERRVTCLVTTEAGWVAEMVYESNGGAKTERGRAPRWIWQGRVSPWRIIAWQPLPAPYMPQVEPGASAERSSEREAG